MIKSIEIQLDPNGAAGSKAVVTLFRFFGPNEISTFVCTKPGRIGYAKWVNQDSGHAASWELQEKINNSAQAKASAISVRL
jgi:hypothetical protein